MADWTVAPCIAAALAEANRLWPQRNRASDGTIGDAAHAATVSDHNPDSRGIVHAFDLTHDPAHGVDCHQLAAGLVNRRDHRIRYLIFDRRILLGPWSDSVRAGKAQPWVWKPYDGSSPHTDHLHVSVGYDRGVEGDTSPWWGEEEDELTMDAEVRAEIDALKKLVGSLGKTLYGSKDDPTHPYSLTQTNLRLRAEIAGLREAIVATAGGTLPADFDTRLENAIATVLREGVDR